MLLSALHNWCHKMKMAFLLALSFVLNVYSLSLEFELATAYP